ncbi:MAG TPA: methyltransferase domain-containing protein [Capillimicrobium sp.]|nr:methyltransferase domain-containing protein [Capillimicrobium sp.]
MSDQEAVRDDWAGDGHPAVAARLRPAAAALLRALGPLDGLDVLDVATGTGTVALGAARAGAAHVVGVDVTPELLAIGRRAADAEGLDAVELIEGDAESLEFEEDRFDVVTSTFGVIFAPRPAVVAGELARVCTPGGRIGLTTWPAGSTSAAIGATIARFVPGADPDRLAPAAWASADGMRELFDPRGVRLSVRRRLMRWRFADADDAARFMLDHVAGLRAALGEPGEADALRTALRGLFAERGRPGPRGLSVPFEYLLVIGTKTG